jgi:hypothetical protein
MGERRSRNLWSVHVVYRQKEAGRPAEGKMTRRPVTEVTRQWEADREAAVCWATGGKLQKAAVGDLTML